MSVNMPEPALPIPIHHDVVGQFREARLVDDLEAGRRESFARVEGRRYLVRDQEILLDQRFNERFRRQMPALELAAEPPGVPYHRLPLPAPDHHPPPPTHHPTPP